MFSSSVAISILWFILKCSINYKCLVMTFHKIVMFYYFCYVLLSKTLLLFTVKFSSVN